MAPFSAAESAAGTPAAPAPTMTTSKVLVSLMSASAIGAGFGRKESVAAPSELLPKVTSLPDVSSVALLGAQPERPSTPTPAAAIAVRDRKLRREMPCSIVYFVY